MSEMKLNYKFYPELEVAPYFANCTLTKYFAASLRFFERSDLFFYFRTPFQWDPNASYAVCLLSGVKDRATLTTRTCFL